MIMLIITVILMLLLFVFGVRFHARYCFGFLARRFYITSELSDVFRDQFACQLAQSSLPCKRFVSSQVTQIFQGPDTRPIIYAAGEIYINEDICKHFSPEVFAAGLAYEQAHYDSGVYIYSVVAMCIIFAGCIPLFAILNSTLQQIFLFGNHWKIFSIIAYVVNLFHVWPLLQLILISGSMMLLEVAFGESVVNFYAKSGYDLKNLLKYLQYVESHVSVGVNQAFNITSNRKRCENLLLK